jgi:hypothetical protein
MSFEVSTAVEISDCDYDLTTWHHKPEYHNIKQIYMSMRFTFMLNTNIAYEEKFLTLNNVIMRGCK